METQDTAFGTQESNSPNEVGLVVRLARSAFLNPSAEAQELLQERPEDRLPETQHPPTRPRTLGISEVGKAQLATHIQKRDKRREDEITAFHVNLAHPRRVPKPRGHKPTNTPGINLESSAS